MTLRFTVPGSSILVQPALPLGCARPSRTSSRTAMGVRARGTGPHCRFSESALAAGLLAPDERRAALVEEIARRERESRA